MHCDNCYSKLNYTFEVGEKLWLPNLRGEKEEWAVRERAHECVTARNKYFLMKEGDADLPLCAREVYWFGESFLLKNSERSSQKCAVCGVKIQVENGLTERHDHEGKLCYGSFMPRGKR
jgi:hypothetical protein